jgi:hypothetical protein
MEENRKRKIGVVTQQFNTKVDDDTINGRKRDWLYFLADGIYPTWSIFCKTSQNPVEEKETRLFATKQEAARKDIERCFGVVVQRFGILKQPLTLVCNDLNNL